MAEASRMGTMKPSTVSEKRSSAPVLAVAMTGHPEARAWAWTRASPSSMLGRTRTWLVLISPARRDCGMGPSHSTSA